MTSDESVQDESAPAAPLLRVVSGNATAEEVAALVAVFASLDSGEAGPAPIPSEWSTPSRRLRTTFPHGPGGWRSSGMPR